jgi:hypothetical protein
MRKKEIPVKPFRPLVNELKGVVRPQATVVVTSEKTVKISAQDIKRFKNGLDTALEVSREGRDLDWQDQSPV